MHITAYKNCEEFYNKYCKELLSTSIIVDVGSFNVNGTVKPIFKKHKYIGVDMSAGPNVDIVANASNLPFTDNTIDIIISSSNFEHDDCFWETFLELCRIVKKNGYIYINAPSAGIYHGFPGDCWRFYADSWKALEKYANKKGYSIVLVETYIDQKCSWKNSVGIFKKN